MPKQGETTTQKTARPKLGLQLNDPKAFQGYTLIAPLNAKKSYLIDMQGRVVRAWESKYTAGQEAYFLENGHLLRAATLDNRERLFGGAGQGGRVQEFDWDGGLVWDFKFHDDKRVAHHAICRLPNGNVLLIVWEIKTGAETVAAGRRPETVRGPWLADSIVEIKPTGKTTGQVVWEWHAWDHLIQDSDTSKANFGDVGKHPELIDVNFGDSDMGFPGGGPPGPPRRDIARKDSPKEDEARKKRDTDRLKTIGYVGNPTARGNRGIIPDWTHVNAVAYNAEFDQIMISVRSFGEFWIIDHSTTTAEAAGHKGGRRGKGETSSTAGAIPTPTAPARRRINGSSPSTIPTGFPTAIPARGTCSSSTMEVVGRPAITRRSTRSSSPSTRREITSARRARRSGLASRSGLTRRQRGRSCSPSSCPAPTGCPTAIPSSAKASAARSSR